MKPAHLIAGRFEIADPEKDLLGRGGMGEVYRAMYTHNGIQKRSSFSRRGSGEQPLFQAGRAAGSGRLLRNRLRLEHKEDRQSGHHKS